MVLYLLQLLGGALNVYLKAPVWMQLFHLLLSDIIWIVLVLLTATALAHATAPQQASLPASSAPLKQHGAV
jgi:heme A synthase